MEASSPKYSVWQRVVFNLRLFYEGARLSYIALFRWLTPSLYLASKVIMPLNQIVFFTVLGTYATGTGNADFYILGNTMQIAALSGIYGVTMSVGGDRWEGTLPYLFGVPSSRLILFLGRALFHIVDGAIGVVMALVLGVLFMGLDLSTMNPLVVGLAIVAATISTSGLGLMLGAVSLVTVNAWFFSNTVYFLLLLTSGANIPRADMPAWLVAVGDFMPLTRAIEAARRGVTGAPLGDVAGLLAGELAMGVIYALVGFACFRWIEFTARKRGTIEQM